MACGIRMQLETLRAPSCSSISRFSDPLNSSVLTCMGISVPVKKFNKDGSLGDTTTTPRIWDLFCKLCHCLDRQRSGGAFLACFDKEMVTKEELKEILRIECQLASHGSTILHMTILSLGCVSFSEAPTTVQVLLTLIGADRTSIHMRDGAGNLPLHYASLICARNEVFEVLIHADPSKSSLLSPNLNGDLPLHLLLQHFDAEIFSVRLLFDNEHKKHILTMRNRLGETPIHKAWDMKYNRIYNMLLRDCVACVGKKPRWRRERLRACFCKYSHGGRHTIKKEFMRELVLVTVTDFDYLKHKIMPLLELAVWKGRGLPKNSKERQTRWITCGAHHIAKGVLEYLWKDPLALYEAEYKRRKSPRSRHSL